MIASLDFWKSLGGCLAVVNNSKMDDTLPIKRPREAAKFKMDEKGRLLDESGKEIDTSQKNRLSLQINHERFEKKKKKSKQYSLAPSSKRNRAQYFDRNLPVKKKFPKSNLIFTNTLQPKSLIANVTPLIEWWDKELTESYNSEPDSSIFRSPVVRVSLPCNDPVNSTSHLATLHLTPKEKKKLKRLQRAKKIKEIQDKVKLGLMDPPEAKTRLVNMMKIMAKELALDPSKTEQEIMEKYNKRIQKHLERNEQNKLNHSQKVDKMLRKLKRDSARESRISVLKFEFFTSQKIKFKILKNASQLALVGVCIVPPKELPGIIIVQGGKRAVKFFTRLCVNRIQWETGKCEVVWTSEIKDANFFNFKLFNVESELEVKKILGKKNAENYWNLVINSKEVKDIVI